MAHLADEWVAPSPLENLWQRVMAALAIGLGFWYLIFVARVHPVGVQYFAGHLKGLLLVMVGGLILVYLYRRISNFVDLGNGIKGFSNPPEAENGVPVKVAIHQYGVVTGRDEGFFWQEEGTWFFRGLHSVFRLNTEDVQPMESWPKSIRPNPVADRPPRLIPLEPSHLELAVEIEVHNRHAGYEKIRMAKRFYREMYDWLEKKPKGSLESLLPPLSIHPSLQRSDLWRFEGFAGALYLVFISFGIFISIPGGHMPGSTEAFTDGVTGAFSLVLFVLAIRLAFQEWRDERVRRKLFLAEQLRSLEFD